MLHEIPLFPFYLINVFREIKFVVDVEFPKRDGEIWSLKSGRRKHDFRRNAQNIELESGHSECEQKFKISS